MVIKDYIIIAISISGWIWGIIQFKLNRKYQKKDKATEKRFEIYSDFMNRMDQINHNIRENPNILYGIPTEILKEILSNDENRVSNALTKFNENLLTLTKYLHQELQFINSELNKLKLVASKKLLLKIYEYKTLLNEYANELQIAINNISTTNDIYQNAKQLEKLQNKERDIKLSELWKSMENLMRDEIDYYSK